MVLVLFQHYGAARMRRCGDREKGFVVFISSNCASKLNLAFLSPLVFFQLYPSAVANCIAEDSVI